MIALYQHITGAAYVLGKPFLGIFSRFDGGDGMWQGRLGRLAPDVEAGGPYDIWLQAASVGEVGLAEVIVNAIDRLMPELNIIVSVSTPAGMARAVTTMGERCPVIPYPLDFPQVVRRVATIIRPKVYACLETELWPNMIRIVRRTGAETVLLNGRVSAKSFSGYLKIRSLTSPVLGGFSQIATISQVYAERFVTLGALSERVIVTGNAKFEGLLERPDAERVAALRGRLDIDEATPVFVAGSIRGGEEGILCEAVETLRETRPALVVFLVPRHPEKISALEKALIKRRLPFQLWSEFEVCHKRSAGIVLVDVIGPLFDLYGLAAASFVGGSLVPKGGQNLFEPAAWGCPVFYGPHTENFEDAREALEACGGGGEVTNAEGLAEAVEGMLCDPSLCKSRGNRARKALEDVARGVAAKQAEIVLGVLRR